MPTKWEYLNKLLPFIAYYVELKNNRKKDKCTFILLPENISKT